VVEFELADKRVSEASLGTDANDHFFHGEPGVDVLAIDDSWNFGF
jgi:hypothetical protein